MTDQGARCPQCQVTFRVTPTQLQAAGGLVRCGFCLTGFDAGAHPTPLAADPPPERPPWLRDESEWRPDDGFDRDRLAALLGPHPDTYLANPPMEAVPAAAMGAEEEQPVLTPPWAQVAPARSASWWPAGAAILVIGVAALVLQALYFQADRLAEQARFRTLVHALCTVLPCRFGSPDRRADAFRVERALVRPLPPDGLRLDAMLTNRGARRLPLPAIRIEFEDIDARPVAARTLTPEQYLDPAVVPKLEAGQSLHLVLDLYDPGPRAVSYRVEPLPQ